MTDSKIADFFGAALIGVERDSLGFVDELKLRRDDGTILYVSPVSDNEGNEWLCFRQSERIK